MHPLLATIISLKGEIVLSGVTVEHRPSTVLGDDQIRGMFDDMDTNGDGLIDRDEMLALLSSLGLPSNNHYLSDLLEQYMDESGACRVTYESFHKYVTKASAKLGQAFDALGGEQAGYITESGLLTALRAMGMSADQSDALKMIQLLDRSRDRRITYSEFCRFACLLPRTQVNNDNIAFCWVDSADYIDGVEFRLSMSPGKHLFQRLLAGGVAGTFSRTMVAPLERLRTIMMASPTALSMRECVRIMWRDGGLVGAFKGNMATALKVLPGSAVQFAVYDCVKERLRAHRPQRAGRRVETLEKLAAGVAAGAASCCVTYPLETIRTMMCVPGCGHGGFVQTALHAVRERGWKGLYAGFSSAVLCEMAGVGLGFWAYELGNSAWERWRGSKPSAREKGIVGACSAVVVMTCTMPLEMCMRRMQIAGTAAGAAFPYRGTLDALVTIARREGFRTFYRGSLFAYAKVVPSIGVMYGLYECTSQALAIGGLRRYDQDQALLRQRKHKRELEQATPLTLLDVSSGTPLVGSCKSLP